MGGLIGDLGGFKGVTEDLGGGRWGCGGHGVIGGHYGGGQRILGGVTRSEEAWVLGLGEYMERGHKRLGGGIQGLKGEFGGGGGMGILRGGHRDLGRVSVHSSSHGTSTNVGITVHHRPREGGVDKFGGGLG